MRKFIDLNILFETNIVVRTVKAEENISKLSQKLRCNYCGKKKLQRNLMSLIFTTGGFIFAVQLVLEILGRGYIV